MPTQYRSASPTELRRLFNAHHYADIMAGKYLEFVKYSGHPASPLAEEPYCTKSQIVSYEDRVTRVQIARVHRYKRPDGTIGLSGRPDPKSVRIGDIVYRLPIT
jgi:hypothetical protein